LRSVSVAALPPLAQCITAFIHTTGLTHSFGDNPKKRALWGISKEVEQHNLEKRLEKPLD
jgi:hypothetical protein